MNKYYGQLRYWIGLLLGAGVAFKFFIFPEVNFFFHAPIFIYLFIGGIVTGFIVRNGIKNAIGAGFLAGIIVEIMWVLYILNIEYSAKRLFVDWMIYYFKDTLPPLWFILMIPIEMAIGGAIGEEFHQLLEGNINKRIIQRIKSVLEHFENNKFKEKLNFIKKYTIFLALLTIILGFIIIFSGNNSSTNTNSCVIG